MSMHGHLAELERKHHELDNALEDAYQHPSTDDLKMLDLKRKKLRLKEEIEQIKKTME